MRPTTLALALLAAPALAGDITPYRAQDIQPVQAQGVQPTRAQDLEPVRAQDVQPKPPAQDVQPVHVVELKPTPPADEVKPTPAPQQAAPPAPRAGPTQTQLAALFGTWRTRLPGAVWTTPSATPGYDTLHVGVGARAGDLVIRANGTYTWQSYGGKKGRWEKGDAEYPVVLVDTSEHKRWKVGLDPQRTGGRELIVWDGGSFAYEGRR